MKEVLAMIKKVAMTEGTEPEIIIKKLLAEERIKQLTMIPNQQLKVLNSQQVVENRSRFQ